MSYERKPTPMTKESADAIRLIQQAGDFDSAVYAAARGLSLLDQIGVHLNRANLPPDTRDLIPNKVEEILAAFAHTKRILLDIQRIAIEQDKLEEQRVQAMARGDQMRVAQVNIQAMELKQTLFHLCRSFDVGAADDDSPQA